MHMDLVVDAHFPGGNILVDQIDGDVISLRQDLRDTNGDWFYWALRIRGAAGRRLTFRFTAGDVIGTRGPAVSLDRGTTWQWLGDACVVRRPPGDISFTYDVPADAQVVLLAFCPTYTHRHLDDFLARHAPASPLQRRVLCRSRTGREVDLFTLDGQAAQVGVLITGRHHACEAMASYCMEGFLDAALADDEVGKWMRHKVNLAVVPFMDADGVEAGDQGKNRRPYDHNRDYGGETGDSIYPETKALRQWAPAWLSRNAMNIAFDMHCPWIRGGMNERAYFVGLPNALVWQRVTAFSRVLEQCGTGPIRYRERDNLPFGQDWNTLDGNAIGGRTCARWASELPNVRFATTLEVPYANAGEVDVTPAAAHTLGRDLAAAVQRYVTSLAKHVSFPVAID